MAELESWTDPTATTSDSDYEYEYADETEDFYFTLDVTKHQSQTISKPNQNTQNGKSKGKQSAQPTDRLQVLDLHSENPLIKLGDSFYSCHWSTDLGTQFHVTKSGVVEEPLRRGYVLDVLGISRARLTCNPVTLHRHRPDAAEKGVGSSAVNAVVLDSDDEQANAGAVPVNTPNAQQHPMKKSISRLAAARQNARDPLVKAQASFLERLAIIKHQRGETDAVPVHGVEELTGPRQDARNAATTTTSNGKRKSVSDDMPDGHEMRERSRKRRLSETQIVHDVDGDSPNTPAQPSDWSAGLSFHQDETARNDIGGGSASGMNVPDGESALNADLEVAHGQTTGQSNGDQAED
jgi:hypothetical protein